MFNICDQCDFEWHPKDGEVCPACNPKEIDQEEEEVEGGVFGTGLNSERWKAWFQAFGIIALVYLIYAFVAGG